LTVPVEKNELLIFNGKALDFLYGCGPHVAGIPLLRFFLSGSSLWDECRYFAALWGIMLIEPRRLPLPLLYEAAARGAAAHLGPRDRTSLRNLALWACRSLQSVIADLATACAGCAAVRHDAAAVRASRSAVDVQEQIGADVLEYLEECFPDWLDELADQTWTEVGGW
jgi:hypothetical protein